MLDQKFARRLVEKTAEAHEIFPEARIIFLVNEKDAPNALKGCAECVLCHQNAFLDPWRYRVSKGGGKYDAIYLARITPAKRHHLAANVGTPIMGIARGSKLANWLKNLGRKVEGSVYDCDWGEVTKHVIASLSEGGDWPQKREEAYLKLRARLDTARSELIAALARRPETMV